MFSEDVNFLPIVFDSFPKATNKKPFDVYL